MLLILSLQVVFDACWRKLEEKYKDVSRPAHTACLSLTVVPEWC